VEMPHPRTAMRVSRSREAASTERVAATIRAVKTQLHTRRCDMAGDLLFVAVRCDDNRAAEPLLRARQSFIELWGRPRRNGNGLFRGVVGISVRAGWCPSWMCVDVSSFLPERGEGVIPVVQGSPRVRPNEVPRESNPGRWRGRPPRLFRAGGGRPSLTGEGEPSARGPVEPRKWPSPQRVGPVPSKINTQVPTDARRIAPRR